MAANAASEQMWLGAIAATCSAGFVALGGIDILRGEVKTAQLSVAPLGADVAQVRDGDTREMPVIMRDVA